MAVMNETPALSQPPATGSPARLQPPPGRYRIDAERSTVTFTTRHLFGLAPVHGTVALRDGTIRVADPVTASSVQARAAASTFRSGSQARDAAVLSPRLLDAQAHPSLTFTSTDLARVPDDEAGQWLLRGELEVRGVTCPFEVHLSGLSVGRTTQIGAAGGTLRASARFRVDRYAFGITAYRGLAARWLTIDIAVVAELAEQDASRAARS
jgi:polyisoprenoid-binding protein YceI